MVEPGSWADGGLTALHSLGWCQWVCGDPASAGSLYQTPLWAGVDGISVSRHPASRLRFEQKTVSFYWAGEVTVAHTGSLKLSLGSKWALCRGQD